MDQHKLRSLVFEKTGVKIDVDDPVFALVALNEAVLEEAVERHVAQIDAATRELIASTGATPPPARAATHAQPAGGNATATAKAPMQQPVLLAAGAAVAGAILTLLGHAVFFKPPVIPAPIVQARELTPEQTAALRNAEKLTRIVDKLDPKTRALIKAEMQKP